MLAVCSAPMSTRRRRPPNPPKPRPYRVPLGVEFNAFVGELGPATESYATELHVKYAVRDNQYVDWSIELNMRLGTLVDYLAGDYNLARRTMAKAWVGNSEIRHVSYGPGRQQTVERVIQLRAGDETVVNENYARFLGSLERQWVADHGPDRHTTATFGYAKWNLDPQFRNHDYPWLYNTLVAVDEDVVEEIVIERGGYYFGDARRTAAVWMPAIERMKFIEANPGEMAEHREEGDSQDRQAALQMTMGMVAAVVNRSDSWADDFLRDQDGSD